MCLFCFGFFVGGSWWFLGGFLVAGDTKPGEPLFSTATAAMNFLQAAIVQDLKIRVSAGRLRTFVYRFEVFFIYCFFFFLSASSILSPFSFCFVHLYLFLIIVLSLCFFARAGFAPFLRLLFGQRCCYRSGRSP